MTPDERLDRLRLARTEGVGPVTYRRLLARFASAATAIDALPGLARSGGRREALCVPGRDDAEREAARLDRIGASLLFLDEPGYPPLLALLADAPSVVAVLGDVACLSARAVALVGARNASTNGCRMAEALATDLAASGLVVVSGLARGIDAAAHQGAMHVGRTVACVAGGLDRPYPPEHARLQAEVAERGAVVAEAGLGVTAQSRHFPRRNRIIAGLSLGVVVVEAALRSGTLITARLAQEAHRELFAVPGSPLDPRSRGSNDLIRQGAWLTEQAADVLANLPDHGPALDSTQARVGWEQDGDAAGPSGASQAPGGRAAPPGASLADDSAAGAQSAEAQANEAVLALLSVSPTPVDEVVRHCHLSAAAVSAALLELELAGRIETLPGNRVCLLTSTGL